MATEMLREPSKLLSASLSYATHDGDDDLVTRNHGVELADRSLNRMIRHRTRLRRKEVRVCHSL